MFRGCSGGASVSGAVFGDQGIRWCYEAEGYSMSSPAIAGDGTIYAASNAALLALNPDGELIWESPYGGTASSVAVGEDGTLFVPGQKLYAFAPDGTEKWETDVDYPLGGPLVLGGRLFVRDFEQTTYFAIGQDGNLVNSVSIQTGGFSGAFAVDASLLVGCWNWEFAYNRYACNIIVYDDSVVVNWKFETSPACEMLGVAKQRVGSASFWAANCGKVYKIETNGELLWSLDLNAELRTAPALAPDYTLLVGAADGLYAVQDGVLKWIHETAGEDQFGQSFGGPVTTVPVVDSMGKVCFGVAPENVESGRLECVDGEGDDLWTQVVPASAHGSPAVGADGVIYVAMDGKLGGDGGRLCAIGK